MPQLFMVPKKIYCLHVEISPAHAYFACGRVRPVWEFSSDYKTITVITLLERLIVPQFFSKFFWQLYRLKFKKKLFLFVASYCVIVDIDACINKIHEIQLHSAWQKPHQNVDVVINPRNKNNCWTFPHLTNDNPCGFWSAYHI